MNVAVILAGGIGNRLGYSYPKYFYKLAGRTIIEHTVGTFEMNSDIHEIAIVINENYVAEIQDIIIRNEWKKVQKILIGGKERYESSLVAINSYINNKDIKLLIHDAVRPLVSQRIINETIEALGKYNVVNVAVPVTDTIIGVNSSGTLMTMVPLRSQLRKGQSPQGFDISTIKKAYDIALADPGFTSTDDCGTVVKYLPDEKIFVVQGEESNMKLTYEEDIFILEKLFQLRSGSSEDSNEN